MLRAASRLLKRQAVVSPSACRQRLQTMAGFSKSKHHPKNYVFGDNLERDQELPHSKSPALEFQVRAVAGRARAAQMQLPHFLCETPMFMPVGTQGMTMTYVRAVCPVQQAPPCHACRDSKRTHAWNARRLQVPPHSRQHLPPRKSSRGLSCRRAGWLAQVLGMEQSNAY